MSTHGDVTVAEDAVSIGPGQLGLAPTAVLAMHRPRIQVVGLATAISIAWRPHTDYGETRPCGHGPGMDPPTHAAYVATDANSGNRIPPGGDNL